MQARPQTGHQSVAVLTQTDRQQFALTVSPTVNLESPVGLKVYNWFKNRLLSTTSNNYMEESRSAAALVQVWPVALFCVSAPSLITVLSIFTPTLYNKDKNAQMCESPHIALPKQSVSHQLACLVWYVWSYKCHLSSSSDSIDRSHR